jgi:hypothetical protein
VDVFQVRDRLIEDYREFTGSFVDIHDKAIHEHVADRMANGYQWPDPWLSLNPSFASSGTVSELIEAGLLQQGNKDIFRLPNGQELRLHKHQKEPSRPRGPARVTSLRPAQAPARAWRTSSRSSTRSCKPRPRAPTSRASKRSWSTR